MFSIFSHPSGVLVFSCLGFFSEGGFVVGNVGGDDSDFSFSFGKGFGGLISQVGEGVDLSCVILDFLF